MGGFSRRIEAASVSFYHQPTIAPQQYYEYTRIIYILPSQMDEMVTDEKDDECQIADKSNSTIS